MSGGPAATSISGRLVLDDRVAHGRITIEDGRIAAVDLDDGDAGGTSPSSRRATSTSTSTAGAATTRWATARPSTGWPGCSFVAA